MNFVTDLPKNAFEKYLSVPPPSEIAPISAIYCRLFYPVGQNTLIRHISPHQMGLSPTFQIHSKLAFHGIPHKDEKRALRSFIAQYNHNFETKFVLHSVPELEHNNTPQPEFLFADGSKKMVIERKTIEWPPNHIRNHNLWHKFNEFLEEELAGRINDDIYVLETYDSDYKLSKRDIFAAAKSIARDILENYHDLPAGYEICDDEPLKWKFFRAEVERLDAPYEHGILFRAIHSHRRYTDAERAEMRTQLSLRIGKLMQSAARKFMDYEMCLRALVLEPYTGLLSVRYDDFFTALQSIAEIPAEIDQIWLVDAVEVEDGVLLPNYNLVYSNGSFQFADTIVK